MPRNAAETARLAALAKSFTSSIDARDRLATALRELLGVSTNDSFYVVGDGVDDALGPVVIYHHEQGAFSGDGAMKGGPRDTYQRRPYSCAGGVFQFGEADTVRRRTDYVRDSAGNESAGPGADEVEIPSWLAQVLAQAASMAKGAGHKYIRRVPKAGGGYRYFYRVSGGQGLGHESEMVVGAKFKVNNAGKEGHFEIVSKNADGTLTLKHDESGQESTVTPAALHGMLHQEHAKAIGEHRAKLAADIKATDDPKAKAKLLAEAGKYGHTKDLAQPHAQNGGEPAKKPEPSEAFVISAVTRSEEARGAAETHRDSAERLRREGREDAATAHEAAAGHADRLAQAYDDLDEAGAKAHTESLAVATRRAYATEDAKPGPAMGPALSAKPTTPKATAGDHTKLYNWSFDQNHATSRATGTAARTMTVGDRDYQLAPQPRPGKPPGFVVNVSMPGRAGSLDAKGGRTATPHLFDTVADAHAAVVKHEAALSASKGKLPKPEIRAQEVKPAKEPAPPKAEDSDDIDNLLRNMPKTWEPPAGLDGAPMRSVHGTPESHAWVAKELSEFTAKRDAIVARRSAAEADERKIMARSGDAAVRRFRGGSVSDGRDMPSASASVRAKLYDARKAKDQAESDLVALINRRNKIADGYPLETRAWNASVAHGAELAKLTGQAGSGVATLPKDKKVERSGMLPTPAGATADPRDAWNKNHGHLSDRIVSAATKGDRGGVKARYKTYDVGGKVGSVAGEMHGQYGVHRTSDGDDRLGESPKYKVTHIPTGKGVGPEMNEDDAHNLAQTLDSKHRHFGKDLPIGGDVRDSGEFSKVNATFKDFMDKRDAERNKVQKSMTSSPTAPQQTALAKAAADSHRDAATRQPNAEVRAAHLEAAELYDVAAGQPTMADFRKSFADAQALGKVILIWTRTPPDQVQAFPALRKSLAAPRLVQTNFAGLDGAIGDLGAMMLGTTPVPERIDAVEGPAHVSLDIHGGNVARLRKGLADLPGVPLGQTARMGVRYPAPADLGY